MIAKDTLNELLAELEKSRDQLVFRAPVMYVKEAGTYAVSNSHGGYYEVVCGRMADRKLFVACQCLASLHGRSCYHALAAVEYHVELKTQEKEIQS